MGSTRVQDTENRYALSPICCMSFRSSGQRWYSSSARRLLLPSTVALGVRRKTSHRLSPPPSARGEPSDCAAAVDAPQKKPGGKLFPPGAANGNDKPYSGRAAASAATPALPRNLRRSRRIISQSYCAVSCSSFTGPSSPEESSGEFALYGFTSAKVYFVVASGC